MKENAWLTGYDGRSGFDGSKLDITMRKLMNVLRLKAFGWQASISLENGLGNAYDRVLENQNNNRG